MKNYSYLIRSFADISEHPHGRRRQFRLDASVVPTEKRGTPEERSSTTRVTFFVSCADVLYAGWGLSDQDGSLQKVLFEYGKRHLEQDIKKNNFHEITDLTLDTDTYPRDCPYDPERIELETNVWHEIEASSPIGFKTSDDS